MRLISIIALGIALMSCQKGEEDPSLSLLSRKSRLTGDWKVTSANIKNSELSATFDGVQMIYTLIDSSKISRDFTWKMVFTKEGGFTLTTTEAFLADSLLNRKDFTRTIEIEGIWEFTGGNNSPSKSQLALFTTQTTTTESDKGSNVDIVAIKDPSSPRIYDMVKLSNKEMKLNYTTITSEAFGQIEESEMIQLKKLN